MDKIKTCNYKILKSLRLKFYVFLFEVIIFFLFTKHFFSELDYCPWWIPCLFLWRRMLFSHWKSCQCYQPCHSPDTGPYVHPFQGPQPRLCPIQTKCPVCTVFRWWWKCCVEEIPKDDCYLMWMPLRSLLTRYTAGHCYMNTIFLTPFKTFRGTQGKNHHSLLSPPVF